MRNDILVYSFSQVSLEENLVGESSLGKRKAEDQNPDGIPPEYPHYPDYDWDTDTSEFLFANDIKIEGEVVIQTLFQLAMSSSGCPNPFHLPLKTSMLEWSSSPPVEPEAARRQHHTNVMKYPEDTEVWICACPNADMKPKTWEVCEGRIMLYWPWVLLERQKSQFSHKTTCIILFAEHSFTFQQRITWQMNRSTRSHQHH